MTSDEQLVAKLREGVLIERIPERAMTLIEPDGTETHIPASYSEIRQGPSPLMIEAADAITRLTREDQT